MADFVGFGALTMVGLIATILSIGFALAAFINSRRQSSNKREKTKDGPPGLPFLAPDGQPARDALRVPAPFYSTAGRQVSGPEQAKPAFKQIQALGMQPGPSNPPNSDEYLWE
jgi:hypothetical protein